MIGKSGAVNTPPNGADRTPGAELRTFLIADIRGYTRFTQQHGDEAAAKLAGRFAEAVGEEVRAAGGTLIELRGDEALAVFDSPRAAVRTGVALHARFARETTSDPNFPLPVGIGLDIGEAVPVEGGYRGSALNLAARLCNLATAGEVLATQSVVHLAGTVPGVRYAARRPARLKGLAEPVRFFQVLGEGVPPPQRQRWWKKLPANIEIPGLRRALPVWSLAVAIAAVALAVVASFALVGSGARGLGQIGANAVGSIDAGSGHVVGSVPVGSRPVALTSFQGALWVVNAADDTVSRVDPKTQALRDSIPVGSNPAAITAAEGALWVANSGADTVSEINPAADKVVQVIRVGAGPEGIAAEGGTVWVTNSLDGTASAIDAASGTVRRRIQIGQNPGAIAVGGNAGWIAEQTTGSVERVDLATGAAVAAVAVGNGPSALAFGDHALWVTNGVDGTLSRIDPATNSVTGTIPVGGNPEGVAVGASGVWVADSGAGRVVQIDPRSERITRSIQIRNSPQAIALDGNHAWVAATASAGAHRGGTLRVASGSIDSLDPASAYTSTAWMLLIAVHDGLVSFRKVTGAAGATIVSDLAVAVPQPSDAGKTYTFQLRSGIRYANGQRLRASDFRLALERTLRTRPVLTTYYAHIIGAPACMRAAARCDLSRGIVTNNAAGTVTFHLSSRDPAFLDRLALPFAASVPAGTPLATNVRTKGPPGTGPYRVASFRPGHEVRLVRNPTFRPWAEDAQPTGFPDTIEASILPGSQAPAVVSGRAVEHVLRGKMDWADAAPFGRAVPQLQRLKIHFASQVHIDPAGGEFYLMLNNKLRPFNDPRVRQALNYAVDRAHIVGFEGGSAVAASTCQFLPPSLPGYHPYCPYTFAANRAGIWHAPDLARAMSLVRSSGTRGERVTIWTFPFQAQLGRYLAGVVAQLGFRASLRVVPDSRYFTLIGSERGRRTVQAGVDGWFQDYPLPSDFIEPLFACDSLYCDASITRQIKAANKVESSAPGASVRLWTRLDRELVDRSAAVPIYTTNSVVLVSRRISNFEYNPQWSTLLDQLWVR